MKIRRLFIGTMFLCVVLSQWSSVRADNVYRINTRAYRHMMATNSHAYRNMMHARYPSLIGQDIRGFVNNNVLQSQGPVDLLIQRLLGSIAAAEQQNETAGTLFAETEASPNPDLTATLEKTREILKTLKVDEPTATTEPPDTITPPPTPNSLKDFSRFEEVVP